MKKATCRKRILTMAAALTLAATGCQTASTAHSSLPAREPDPSEAALTIAGYLLYYTAPFISR